MCGNDDDVGLLDAWGDGKRSLGVVKECRKRGGGRRGEKQGLKKESWGVCNNFVCYLRDNNDEKKQRS